MNTEDLQYLCSTIGSLAGIPIRLYKNEECIYFYSIANLIKDPIIPYQKKIFSIKENVGYYITENFFIYGIINSENHKIILGPARQQEITSDEKRNLAFQCDIPSDAIEEFITELDGMRPFPLNSLVQVLCSINFILNHEKLTLADITIYDDEQEKITRQINQDCLKEEKKEENTFHNTTNPEQTIMYFVRQGNTSALKEWISHAPSIQSGKLSENELRQQKDTFIVTATLVSRAAIQGGLNQNEALTLSDRYIQKCEMLNTIESITNLQFHMVLDFTEKVEKLHLGKSPSKFLIDISNQVQKHLHEPTDITAIAKDLFLSRTYMATKFKKETGMTLSDYILKEKIMEAKALLRYSDKSISLISLYLGFSSQSHFTNTFKKIVGISPNEYKAKHIK